MTQFLFLAYSDEARQTVTWMSQRLLRGMQQLNYSQSQINQVSARMHFVVKPVTALTDSWIPTLLANWTTEYKGLSVYSQSKQEW